MRSMQSINMIFGLDFPDRNGTSHVLFSLFQDGKHRGRPETGRKLGLCVSRVFCQGR
jgi:hypothetical protein